MEKYQIISQIGRGNYGDIYLVINLLDGLKYVLKRISTFNISKSEKNKIENEALILKNLHHPFIVKYIEYFYTDDDYFIIVMEYYEDGDLYNFIRNSDFYDEGLIMVYFTQLLLAVSYLHSNNILHRDIKTSNIFLKGNRVILGDFGISKLLNNSQDFTTTYIGTPYYMSPELFKYKPYNFKSDIWALGCVLYEISYKRNPFNAENLNNLITKIMKGTIDLGNNYYTTNLKDIIKSCLSTDEKKRINIYDLFSSEYIKYFISYNLELFIKEQLIDKDSITIITNQLNDLNILNDIIYKSNFLKQYFNNENNNNNKGSKMKIKNDINVFKTNNSVDKSCLNDNITWLDNTNINLSKINTTKSNIKKLKSNSNNDITELTYSNINSFILPTKELPIINDNNENDDNYILKEKLNKLEMFYYKKMYKSSWKRNIFRYDKI